MLDQLEVQGRQHLWVINSFVHFKFGENLLNAQNSQ